MKCQKCVESKKESKLFISNAGVSTLMGWGSGYYDEGGNHHDHDPNRIAREFHCSNGHRGIFIMGNKCKNCDYGHAPEFRFEE